jgi:hypothetical protein
MTEPTLSQRTPQLPLQPRRALQFLAALVQVRVRMGGGVPSCDNVKQWLLV